MSLYIRNYIYF